MLKEFYKRSKLYNIVFAVLSHNDYITSISIKW
jgi:hypothetical protein